MTGDVQVATVAFLLFGHLFLFTVRVVADFNCGGKNTGTDCRGFGNPRIRYPHHRWFLDHEVGPYGFGKVVAFVKQVLQVTVPLEKIPLNEIVIVVSGGNFVALLPLPDKVAVQLSVNRDNGGISDPRNREKEICHFEAKCL